MSEIIERVARAIWEASGWPDVCLDEARANELRSQAKAAIPAMREPTWDMIEAGQIAAHASIGLSGDALLSREEIARIWRAMIDAAAVPG